MGLKLIGSIAALMLIAACETVPEEMADADGGGAVAPGAAGPQVAAGPVTPGPTAAVVAPEDAPPAPGSFDEFVKLVGDRVFFGFDQIDLLPQAQET
ncbi:MAG: peptidoglycan-associated lipoprotein, partial [Alphaproteobacteria bacterium]|nr:peptidoglycan-associated lipoprotein [Alphaproteobacteria bacterium]